MSLNMGDSTLAVDAVGEYDWSQSDSGYLHSAAEVGIHCGATMSLMLERHHAIRWYVGIDSFDTYDRDHPYRKSGDGCSKLTASQQAENMQAAEMAVEFAGERAFIYHTDSLSAARNMAEWQRTGAVSKLSFVLQDGDHTRDGVWHDLCAWWPLIEKGGVLFVHDYGHRRFSGVKESVDRFIEKHELQLHRKGSLVWMVRP